MGVKKTRISLPESQKCGNNIYYVHSVRHCAGIGQRDRQTDRQNWFINIALLCTDMLTRDKNTYAFLCWTTPYAFTILEVYRKPKRYVAHH